MGHASVETEGEARRDDGPAPAPPSRLCGRFTNGIDAKSRVVMPAAFRAPFAADGGLITPWRGTCLAAMAPGEFDLYVARAAASLADAGEDVDRHLSTLWSSTVTFGLDLQGRLVLPEEVRSQVGITDEVRFQGRGRRVELWPGAITAEELDERADHLVTLGVVQSAYIPELES
ncbi:division/cell wall cluster transcriptional repressor MraZ [Iamia majanohamensis]|uniref:Transcriptional regulator MraZ n=1 Tax=Iamia majanohamensis TaxID=467976 RepID=A0AAF0BUB9_9ACTN|nr:division/cell wall cluster transcriptional repressor MraZ [Iamia majanohamensis]WCO65229.1 division/cell wall cluster transcriptional repressor MraZ [Iamia majanohamensis]